MGNIVAEVCEDTSYPWGGVGEGAIFESICISLLAEASEKWTKIMRKKIWTRYNFAHEKYSIFELFQDVRRRVFGPSI